MSSGELKPIGNAQAIIEKVQTLRDGGFRITIDLPDTEIGLVSKLLAIKADLMQSKIFYVSFIQKPEGYL